MLSLFGSLLGFGTSFLPKVMDFFQDKQDKAHELALMQAQAEIQERIQAGKLQATIVESEAREVEALHREHTGTVRKASQFFINLSVSIRPVVTYCFLVEFIAITWSIAYLIMERDGVTIEALQSILNDDFMGLFSAIMAFWFGSREVRRREGRL